jgi:Glycogen debranching enzyme N terminal
LIKAGSNEAGQNGGAITMATPQRAVAQQARLADLKTADNTTVRFGREICGTLELAEQGEWLATNGIGGFASGTVSGNLTRRYHGLLFAALKPSVGRTQMIAKLEETVEYSGFHQPLSTNRWASGAVDPQGYLSIESFHLDGTVPVWRYVIADACLEKANLHVPRREHYVCSVHLVARQPGNDTGTKGARQLSGFSFHDTCG